MFTIYGAALNPATGKWRAFNEDTLTVLSEHSTERAALAACRYYTECQMRRASRRGAIKRSPPYALANLAHHAI